MRLATLALALCAHGLWPAPRLAAQAASGAPATPARPVTDEYFGTSIVDPYRWLEDRNSPETGAWIDAQNGHTQSVLGALPGREQLKQRLSQLEKIDAMSPPIARAGRYFFSRRLASQELYVICVREGLKGADHVLVDPHAMSPDHTTSVELWSASKDGSLVAYAVREGGQDEVVVRLLDVDTRKDLPDLLPRGRYFGVALKPDKSGLFYARGEKDGPRVYYHARGTDAAKDVKVFGDGYGPDKIMVAELSEDGRYLLIHVLHGAAAHTTEVHVQDLTAGGPLKAVVSDLPARFFGAIGGDQLFLHTNWTAPKSRVMAVDLKRPEREHWREVIPEADAVLESLVLAGGRLLANYTRNVSSQVKVFEPGGKAVGDLALPALGTASFAARWESKEAFLIFSSYVIPMTIYRHDVATGGRDLWARLEVPVDSQRLEVKQVWYESKDKTRVPMFLVHAKGIQLDGSRPTLLTGYGGFNASYTPWFTAAAVLWAEHGGVYAVANLRGGGEFGEDWHRAGMLAQKQNVFDDFIAAAEWLIGHRYTNPSRLAIEGGSNGGLLVGAAITQRPELFGAVGCAYPLLDMLRFQKFLVAQYWVSEYGSSDDPAQFHYLRAYSPYHQVKPGTKYPPILFVTGDSDTRVDPLHARKMTALLQSVGGPERPVLLRYDTKAGHSGGLPVSKQIEEMTDAQIFLLWQVGVPQYQPPKPGPEPRAPAPPRP